MSCSPHDVSGYQNVTLPKNLGDEYAIYLDTVRG